MSVGGFAVLYRRHAARVRIAHDVKNSRRRRWRWNILRQHDNASPGSGRARVGSVSRRGYSCRADRYANRSPRFGNLEIRRVIYCFSRTRTRTRDLLPKTTDAFRANACITTAAMPWKIWNRRSGCNTPCHQTPSTQHESGYGVRFADNSETTSGNIKLRFIVFFFFCW